MAQTVPIKLSKFDNQPWGFRIQGGKDFSTPITVQKVNGGSLAERAGLNAGDTILSINGIDALKLRHKEAQDTLVKAGNNFEIVVVRGNVWKPAVTPLAEPKIQQNGEQILTKTSLASNQQAPKHIGSAHNLQPAPFGKKQVPSVNGAPIQQYNSPVGLYSEESIAETLTAQAEVLSQGVLGVNFKKNERQYNAAQSEVLKMIQENDNCQKAPESTEPPVHAMSSRPAGIRPVEYPKPKPKTDDHSGIAPDLTKCGDCDRLIVGVFVKIKDRNLHVECFKCATCGTSLKNVGYYNISGKLYCDIHARQAARHHPEQPEQVVATDASSPVPPPAVQLEKIRPRAQAAAQLQAAAAAAPAPAPTPAPAPEPVYHPAPSPVPVAAPSVVKAPAFNQVLAPKATGQDRPLSAPVAPTVSAPSFVAPYMPAPTPAPAVGASGQTTSAPRRGKGVLSHAVAPGVRVPVCSACEKQIRGPFVTALGRNWCPEHFVCANDSCKRHLQEVGFIEEKNELYCESCFENYLAPVCDKCQKRVIGDCLKAIGKQFHPECFACAYCGRLFGNSRFYLEDGLPYCEADWNELFTTKCFGCGFPIEAGDRWVEAMNNNYHSQCFNCSVCKKNLEGQSFLAKGGKPMCKSHAARV